MGLIKFKLSRRNESSDRSLGETEWRSGADSCISIDQYLFELPYVGDAGVRFDWINTSEDLIRVRGRFAETNSSLAVNSSGVSVRMTDSDDLESLGLDSWRLVLRFDSEEGLKSGICYARGICRWLVD